MPIQSTGETLTDNERALKAVLAALERIRRDCDAAIVAARELKEGSK